MAKRRLKRFPQNDHPSENGSKRLSAGDLIYLQQCRAADREAQQQLELANGVAAEKRAALVGFMQYLTYQYKLEGNCQIDPATGDITSQI